MHFLLLFASLFIVQLFLAQENSQKIKLKLNQYGVYDQDLLPSSFHKKNRSKLRNLMAENSVAVFFPTQLKTVLTTLTFNTIKTLIFII